jgi:hypothetical protein
MSPTIFPFHPLYYAPPLPSWYVYLLAGAVVIGLEDCFSENMYKTRYFRCLKICCLAAIEEVLKVLEYGSPNEIT